MRAIHRIQRVNTQVALDALAELTTTRLLTDVPADRDADTPLQDRVEKVCVTYVLFATTAPGAASFQAIDGLLATLDAVAQRSKKPFTAKATHAAQTLLWKAAGAAESEIADRWCIILRHPLFESAGHINKARIGRYDNLAMLLLEATNR